MAYATRDDWTDDRGRHNSEVHYRLYVGHDGQVAVICAQDFDYLDYDARRVLSPEVFETEADAEHALRGMLSLIIEATARLIVVSGDQRARMLAAAVREAL